MPQRVKSDLLIGYMKDINKKFISVNKFNASGHPKCTISANKLIDYECYL